MRLYPLLVFSLMATIACTRAESAPVSSSEAAADTCQDRRHWVTAKTETELRLNAVVSTGSTVWAGGNQGNLLRYSNGGWLVDSRVGLDSVVALAQSEERTLAVGNTLMASEGGTAGLVFELVNGKWQRHGPILNGRIRDAAMQAGTLWVGGVDPAQGEAFLQAVTHDGSVKSQQVDAKEIVAVAANAKHVLLGLRTAKGSEIARLAAGRLTVLFRLSDDVQLEDIALGGDGSWIAVGESIDGGFSVESWRGGTPKRRVMRSAVRAAYLSAANEAYAVGDSGFIARLVGGSWLPMDSGTRANLNDISAQSGELFAVGDRGTIVQFRCDGAAIPAPMPTQPELCHVVAEVPGELYGVDGPSADDFIAAGSGFVWRVLNQVPTLIWSESNVSLQGVAAGVDAVWVVGVKNGVKRETRVIRCTGDNCENVSPPTTVAMRAVAVNGSTVWAAGVDESPSPQTEVWRFDETEWHKLPTIVSFTVEDMAVASDGVWVAGTDWGRGTPTARSLRMENAGWVTAVELPLMQFLTIHADPRLVVVGGSAVPPTDGRPFGSLFRKQADEPIERSPLDDAVGILAVHIAGQGQHAFGVARIQPKTNEILYEYAEGEIGQANYRSCRLQKSSIEEVHHFGVGGGIGVTNGGMIVRMGD